MANQSSEQSSTALAGLPMHPIAAGIVCSESGTRPWRAWMQQHAVAMLLVVQWLVSFLLGAGLLSLPPVPHHGSLVVWPLLRLLGFFLVSGTAAFAIWHGMHEQHADRKLLHVAYHDPATNLPNRTAMEQILDGWLCAHEPVSCLYMEVDGAWNRVEPACETGANTLSQSLVERLKPLIRQGDVLAHLAADRFVILLRGAQPRSSLVALAERLIDLMSSPGLLQHSTLHFSISIGIASSPSDSVERSALLAAAKGAMVLARSEERNTYRFADAVGRVREDRFHMVSGKLQRAIIGGALQLVYQPIYSSDGRLVAAEALARWHDSDEGAISPGEFVPVAEATGLIVPLSNWVLRQACQQMAIWTALHAPLQRIAVNVSVKQVSRGDFVETILGILQENGLAANRLELEITESSLASDFEAVNNNLQTLRRSGVRISIDDFGTGYSSLSRVRDLNADVLKIDRVFTQGAGESASGAAMVQAIIEMAHTLQLSVIAEGIETKEQMNILREMACDEMQGFLLARPQVAEVLTQELQETTAASQPGHSSAHLVPRLV